MRKKLLIIISFFILSSFSPIRSFSDYSAKECLKNIECAWDAFSNIAFGSEDGNTKSNKYLKKWVSPIKIGVVGKYNKNLLSSVVSYVWLLENVINKPELKIAENTSANMWVIFTDNIKESYTKIYSKSNIANKMYNHVEQDGGIRCLGTIMTNENHEIYQAVIFIPNSLNDWQTVGCIQEEITQSLGLINDRRGVLYTKFNDSDSTKELTVLDWFLLKALYNPDIKAGMKRNQVKSVFIKLYNNQI